MIFFKILRQSFFDFVMTVAHILSPLGWRKLQLWRTTEGSIDLYHEFSHDIIYLEYDGDQWRSFRKKHESFKESVYINGDVVEQVDSLV